MIDMIYFKFLYKSKRATISESATYQTITAKKHTINLLVSLLSSDFMVLLDVTYVLLNSDIIRKTSTK